MDVLILSFVEKYPQLASALMIMGALRVVLKPLMVFLEEHVASTPDKADDEKLAKVKASKVYKALCFILDYVASIKLPK